MRVQLHLKQAQQSGCCQALVAGNELFTPTLKPPYFDLLFRVSCYRAKSPKSLKQIKYRGPGHPEKLGVKWVKKVGFSTFWHTLPQISLDGLFLTNLIIWDSWPCSTEIWNSYNHCCPISHQRHLSRKHLEPSENSSRRMLCRSAVLRKRRLA